MKQLLIAFAALVFLIMHPGSLTAATVSGAIIDGLTGDALIGANLVVDGTNLGAAADADGRFVIRNIASGKISLRASMLGYESITRELVISAEDDSLSIEVSLIETPLRSKEVVIQGNAEKGSAARELEDRIASVIITDAISAENLRKTPDPDVAGAIRRATGVSSMDGDPVIRGLDARYSKVSLNNSFISGTDPNRSAVSLDLFPSSMMSQITINKSYTPDQFGEFGGGTINMNTWDALGENELSVSTNVSMNSQTTGRKFMTYDGGNLDPLGFDDGTRALPDAIVHAATRITQRGQFSDIGYTTSELEILSEAFPNTWNTNSTTANPNQSFNWSLSRASSLFGRKMDYMLSSRYGNSANYRETQRSIFKGGVGGSIEEQHSYDFKSYDRSVGLGGIAAFRWETSSLTRFDLQSLYNHELSDETRFFEGWNDDRGAYIRDTRLRFVSQNAFANQLSARHVMPSFAQSIIDLKLSYSLATRYEPDTREVQYESYDGVEYLLADESQSGSRIFNDLTDNTVSAALDWTFHPGNQELSIKTGFAFLNRTRDSQTRLFQFEPQSFNNVDISQNPEAVFSSENLGPSGFLVRETTRPTDSYGASQQLSAVYLMAEKPLAPRLRLITGVRTEHSAQEVNSYELFAATTTPVKSELRNLDFLPAANLIYALRNNENLRLSASQTVSRPDFRELSAFEFTDVIGGHAVIGNPALKRALIRNFDIRWEKMSGAGDLFAVSAFYKHFANPIEITIQPTAQNRVSYENATAADNYGLELELRRHLGTFAEILDAFSVSANLALVHSNIQLSDSTKGIQTSSRRPLHGQSPYLLNTGLNYRNRVLATEADLFMHVFGKRIAEVGSKPLPDIYEMPHPDLDLSLRQPLNKSFSLSASVRNLLNPEIRFRQGDEFTETYREGRTFALGIGYRR